MLTIHPMQVEVVRALLVASNQAVEVDIKDWKGNRLLDHLEEGEIKQMVWSRLVAEVMKVQLETGFQNRNQSENERVSDTPQEELTVKNLRKEVEKIHQLGEDYEFEDQNDESSEALEAPGDKMLGERDDSLADGEALGERKRGLEEKSLEEKSGGARTVRFRGS